MAKVMKFWLIVAYLLFAQQEYNWKWRIMAAVLFMWLSRQTSFKNLVEMRI